MPAITVSTCWNFPDCPPEEGAPRLRDLGCEAVEIWSQELRRWGVRRWADALRANGLACAQLCPYLDVVHGPATIEMGRWVVAAMRDACAELGCARIRVFTGPPWGRWTVGPRQADAEQWREAAAALADYCDLVGRGIELCLECHEGSLMEDAASARRLIDAVDRSNLSVNLQLPFAGEAPLASAGALAKWTTHIHIHAYEHGWSGGLRCLADGTTDWEPVLRRLFADGGRDLTLSLEHLGHGDQNDDPWRTAARDVPWLRELRERLRG
jgi:sugar phosphate isomerase/epimerase